MGPALAVGVVDNATFQRAMAALQARNITDAERLFKDVLRTQPKHVAALNLLGVIFCKPADLPKPRPTCGKRVNEYPKSDATLYNYGIALKALNRPAEALDRFGQALALNPNAVETWNNRGTVFNDLGRHDEAVGDFDKAIGSIRAMRRRCATKASRSTRCSARPRRWRPSRRPPRCGPTSPKHGSAAPTAMAGSSATTKRLPAFEKALTLKPDLAEAWLGAGNLSSEIGRYPEALTAYDKARGPEAGSRRSQARPRQCLCRTQPARRSAHGL